MTKEAEAVPVVVARRGRRRSFTEQAKQRIVEETCQPGASISAVGRRYGIAASVLFRWRREAGLAPMGERATFLPVQIADGDASANGTVAAPGSAPPALIVERRGPAVEIELIGGRKLRVEHDADPENVCRLIAALEAAGT